MSTLAMLQVLEDDPGKTVTDVTPDRVTTDGHDSYPRAI
jgi:hypothetical protein